MDCKMAEKHKYEPAHVFEVSYADLATLMNLIRAQHCALVNAHRFIEASIGGDAALTRYLDEVLGAPERVRLADVLDMLDTLKGVVVQVEGDVVELLCGHLRAEEQLNARKYFEGTDMSGVTYFVTRNEDGLLVCLDAQQLASLLSG
ncbi:MAG: hypothetical protein CVV05_01355 [Gammaproteobacteria bacterium HGW-Gammaproteobacteria-1]|jgi:hypothetical protein|nr:MAG: hypothetical protein CVV05_01355 [Gammaproteobacteria bacterium HGW-Gammaproteobacteria-1]